MQRINRDKAPERVPDLLEADTDWYRGCDRLRCAPDAAPSTVLAKLEYEPDKEWAKAFRQAHVDYLNAESERKYRDNTRRLMRSLGLEP